jgi:hypothetical protein
MSTEAEQAREAQRAQDLGEARVKAQQAGKQTGTTDAGVEWTLIPPFQPDAPRYPKVETHLWGMWPVLAIETGGYRDLEAKDPYTGRALNARVIRDGQSIYDALRLLIDAMEAVDFLPDGPTDA